MAVVCPSCGTENPDSAKFCSQCATPLGQIDRPRESRRTVTILFADVSGSTSLGEQLDPESMRALMSRYFAEMRIIIEHHGGTVEKFIGDAVMAVFGIPQLHEDDALRAVRASAEIRERLSRLNADLEAERGVAIRFRTGVNTGEVVAGDPSVGQTFVTGDTVNTAARLEQAAQPAEILLGHGTYRLVRDAVVAEPIEPIEAKGKAEPVPAYRLVSVTPGAAGHARRLDAPMVGRDRELHLLTDAFDRAVEDQAGQLVTMLGAAGVGKSRLVQEFQQQAKGQATFLMGRCLSYGEGLTYWPLADALRTHVAINEDEPLESWRAGLLALVAGQPNAQAIVDQVAGLIGIGETASGADAFWAVRRLLEGMARERPLVLVIDDLHWATPTFLDLIEHVADWTHDVPILLVCLARPELLDLRSGWGGGRMNATSFLLEPLDAASIDRLLSHLITGADVATGRRRRIAAAAEGNPLFVEELVAMLTERDELIGEDHPGGSADTAELEVPPTIEALMAARIDQLPAEEREVLERGSVIGMQFGAGEVSRLADDSGPVAVRPALMAMVRRDLLRPDPDASLPLGADDEGFRFHHHLIRDAAYARMSKAERARLHERYARLLEELSAEQVRQIDEVIGYHLEHASLLWSSLGGESDGPETASRAAGHLSAAGMRAYARADAAATSNLLGRAAALLPAANAQRIAFLPTLGRALADLGRFDEAEAAVSEAIEATSNGSDPSARVTALIVRARLGQSRGATTAAMAPDLDEALAIAEAVGDPSLVALVQTDHATLAWIPGQLGEARRQLERAVDTARQSGDLGTEARARDALGYVAYAGTNPATDIERILADNIAFAREHGRRDIEALMLVFQAVGMARQGEFPSARLLLDESDAILEGLGSPVLRASTAMGAGSIEFLAEDLAARERLLRQGYEQLQAMGERGFLSTAAAGLADALVDLGRLDEAEALCAVAEEAGAEDDVATQVGVRLVRGRLAAAHGTMDDALTFAASALALADQGEFYDLRTGSRLVFAQLLLDVGRIDEARARAQEVIDLAQVRGDVIFEARARDIIERTAAAESGSH
jgi:class 3 adenylate cyclase/tetratricopeptide (TPR) repeat protein